MTRKHLVNVAASVRARLLKASKERQEDFTLTLMNYAAERDLLCFLEARRAVDVTAEDPEHSPPSRRK